MKKNWILIVGVALLVVAAVLMVNSASNPPQVTAVQNANQPAAQTPAAHHEHSTGATAQAVPAHMPRSNARYRLDRFWHEQPAVPASQAAPHGFTHR